MFTSWRRPDRAPFPWLLCAIYLGGFVVCAALFATAVASL